MSSIVEADVFAKESKSIDKSLIQSMENLDIRLNLYTCLLHISASIHTNRGNQRFPLTPSSFCKNAGPAKQKRSSVGVQGFACEAGVSGWRPKTPTGLSGDGLPSKDNVVFPENFHLRRIMYLTNRNHFSCQHTFYKHFFNTIVSSLDVIINDMWFD